MHTFYDPRHIYHDPAQLQQVTFLPVAWQYREIAQRSLVIHDAVKTTQLGPITPPGDFGIEPIAELHTHNMLTILQNAYQQMQQEVGKAVPIIPHTFPVNTTPSHKPYAIQGQLGLVCYDTFSPIFEHTWQAAYWSAQTAVSAAALVLAGSEQYAYALCRPPGHHASYDKFGGGCYLNNAAIAANWLAQQGQRVAILDIDYFHGNGTQAIFYGRSDVLFCSIHADPLTTYPYYWGFADEFGTGAGQNYNFNFPLPKQANEFQYMAAFDEALFKIRQFVPDTLLISFGTDFITSSYPEPAKMPPSALGRLGAKIAAFDLPTIIVQEGGYDVTHLGEFVVDFLNGICGG
ncbi:MAG: histone deacetylase family protein [Anaerolineales bacterium]|nr:histone deacetylase family protein [Anaerolineales bacterium]